MNKIALWVTLGVIVVGGLVYFGGKQNMKGDRSESEISTVRPSGKKMAFTEFIKTGGSYKCIVNQNIADTQTSGTVFVNNGFTRGMFKTATGGTQVESNFLIRDGFSYFWSSASPMGIKTVVSVGDVQTQQVPEAYSWNPEDVGDYNCVDWSADTATFTIPTDVQFMDLAQMKTMYTR